MPKVFEDLKTLISVKDFTKIFLSLGVIILSSFFELFGLFTLFIFIQFIIETDSNELISSIIDFLNIFQVSDDFFFLILTCSLIIASSIFYIFAGFLNSYIAQIIGVNISKKIFFNYLVQNLNVINMIRENVVINILLTQVQRITNGIIYEILNMISKFLLSFLIVGMLTILNPKISISVLIVFLMIYSLYFFFNKKKVKKYGLMMSNLYERKIKIIRESLSNNKFVYLNQSFNVLAQEFEKTSSKIALIAAKSHIIPHLPKSTFEITAIIFFCTYFFIFSGTPTFYEDLLIIPFYLACILKIMPLATSIYASTINYNINKNALEVVINTCENFINKNNYKQKQLTFHNELKISISKFNYSNKKILFEDVNLSFIKGRTYFLGGISGSGKSSLLNLLTGYMHDKRCKIFIDDKSINIENNQFAYTSLFNYVSSESFFLDDTILNNIIFSFEENPSYNSKKLKKIISITNFDKVFEDSKINLKTKIKNNAESLSNGQRQRLALCRALYQDAKILILDEATNSLDINSELKIIKEIKIFSPKIVIINVSHRDNLKKVSDEIIIIKNNRLTKKK